MNDYSKERIDALLRAVGKLALSRGEPWRIGEGSEVMDAYEAVLTAPAAVPAPAPSEPVAEVTDMKYGRVKFLPKNAQGDTLPYLQPGTKLYDHAAPSAAAPSAPDAQQAVSEWRCMSCVRDLAQVNQNTTVPTKFAES